VTSNIQSTLILRQEYFGGILFSTQDATYMELDHEAFDMLQKYLTQTPMQMIKDILALKTEGMKLFREILVRHLPRDYRKIKLIKNAKSDFLSAPTLVDLQVTNQCFMDCPHCYASSHPAGLHADFESLKSIISDCSRMGVFQIAIGGGEPLLHPRISEILYLIRENGIVPNLTTTGHNLTLENLKAIKETCGAVALSLEGQGRNFSIHRKTGWDFFLKSLNKLNHAKIPVVFQVTLSKENLDNLPDIVNFALEERDLYGVIFLAYKPVGRGKFYNHSLSSVDSVMLHAQLKDTFLRLSKHTRVGYDCCLTPGIVGIEEDFGMVEFEQLEGCSATRSSLGLTNDFDVLPCTFLPELKFGNLKTQSLSEVWFNSRTVRFRNRLIGQADKKPVCRGCDSKASCLGGCPVWDLVNCKNNYLDQKAPLVEKVLGSIDP
jgi:radical SAM protein with 4Fe4S-binding SPASM domain